MSNDQSPDSLDLRPQPWVKRLSKRGGVLAGVGLMIALGVMIYSVQHSGSKPPAVRTVPETQEGRVLLEQPETGGMVSRREETAKPAPMTKGDASPLVAQPARTADPAVRQEWERIRQYRSQLQLQALQSPLSVPVPVASTRSAVQVAQIRQGRDSVYDRHPVEGQNEQYNPAAQKDKEDFLERRSGGAGEDWVLPHARAAGTACEIKTGTVIPGIMLSGINSDLPGVLVAQVSQHVYDTPTGKMLLIPQGSRLFGKYDSRIIMGQSRVLVAWNRIVFPDGSSVNLGSMPGADAAGYAGFTDQVDNHYWRIYGNAFLMSLITGGMAYSMDTLRPDSGNGNSSQRPTLQDEMGSALSSQMGQASLQLLQKNINVQPTLEIRPGYRFNLVAVKDVVFDSAYTPLR